MRKTGLVGIYKIECFEEKLVYIGQSINLLGRIKNHKSALVNNKHVIKMLQTDFNKFDFTLEIIEHCDNDELLHKETWWIDYYLHKNYYLYNTVFDTVNPPKILSVHKDYYKIIDRTYNLLLTKQLSLEYLDDFLSSI